MASDSRLTPFGCGACIEGMGSIRTFAAALAILAVSSLNGVVCLCGPERPTPRSEHACCAPPTGVSANDTCCDTSGRDLVATVSVDPPLLPAIAVRVACLGEPFAAHTVGVIGATAPPAGPGPPLILRV